MYLLLRHYGKGLEIDSYHSKWIFWFEEMMRSNLMRDKYPQGTLSISYRGSRQYANPVSNMCNAICHLGLGWTEKNIDEQIEVWVLEQGCTNCVSHKQYPTPHFRISKIWNQSENFELLTNVHAHIKLIVQSMLQTLTCKLQVAIWIYLDWVLLQEEVNFINFDNGLPTKIYMVYRSGNFHVFW